MLLSCYEDSELRLVGPVPRAPNTALLLAAITMLMMFALQSLRT